jgi:hypothetical protein
MIIKIDKTTKEQELQNWTNKVRNKRIQNQKSSLEKFFGALPDIGDGLKFQKKARNEWD